MEGGGGGRGEEQVRRGGEEGEGGTEVRGREGGKRKRGSTCPW